MRTFSDFHTTEKDSKIGELSALTEQSNKPYRPKVRRRTLSLDGMLPNNSTQCMDSFSHKKEGSNATSKCGKLKFHPEPYDNDESSHIGQAITMRHQGKLEESAQRLKKPARAETKLRFCYMD